MASNTSTFPRTFMFIKKLEYHSQIQVSLSLSLLSLSPLSISPLSLSPLSISLDQGRRDKQWIGRECVQAAT